MFITTDYPISVLETYDAIEKLLVEKEDQPLVNANRVVSDALLTMLHNLYKTEPNNEQP